MNNQVEFGEGNKKNYHRDIQQALCQITGIGGGFFLHSDVVHFEGLTGLPGVALQGVGRVGLPLGAEQEGRVETCTRCSYSDSSCHQEVMSHSFPLGQSGQLVVLHEDHSNAADWFESLLLFLCLKIAKGMLQSNPARPLLNTLSKWRTYCMCSSCITGAMKRPSEPKTHPPVPRKSNIGCGEGHCHCHGHGRSSY